MTNSNRVEHKRAAQEAIDAAGHPDGHMDYATAGGKRPEEDSTFTLPPEDPDALANLSETAFMRTEQARQLSEVLRHAAGDPRAVHEILNSTPTNEEDFDGSERPRSDLGYVEAWTLNG